MKSRYSFIENNVTEGQWDLQTAAKEAYACAKRLRKKRRIPELEKWILNSASKSSDYAKFILRERWAEAEPIILKEENPKILYNYIHSLIRCRWPEAEKHILKSPEYAYKYAVNIIKNRWPEAEKSILNSEKNTIRFAKYFYGFYSFKYAADLIKNRWIELEELISDIPEALQYYSEKVLMDVLPEEIHNKMICVAISSTNSESSCGKRYLEFAKEIRIDFVKKLKRFDPNLTIEQLIEICDKK